jgi:hypothetical protein
MRYAVVNSDENYLEDGDNRHIPEIINRIRGD